MKHHANALWTESHKNHLNTVNVWTSDVFKMLLRERQTIAQTPKLCICPLLMTKTGTEGKASNASCTPASLTSHIAGPWSPRLWWSPGPSAETAGQVTQRQTESKQRAAELCLHCSWHLASCWRCQWSPLQSSQSGNHPGRRRSASSGCKETLGLSGDRVLVIYTSLYFNPPPCVTQGQCVPSDRTWIVQYVDKVREPWEHPEQQSCQHCKFIQVWELLSCSDYQGSRKHSYWDTSVV